MERTLAPISDIDPQREREILSRATFRAAAILGLSQHELGEILGISDPSVSRMKDGAFSLPTKAFQLAVCLVRIFRSLDAITGGDDAAARSWLATENAHLNGVPKAMLRDPAGLVDVMNYVDAQRAPL
jgi:hypothetical protein